MSKLLIFVSEVNLYSKLCRIAICETFTLKKVSVCKFAHQFTELTNFETLWAPYSISLRFWTQNTQGFLAEYFPSLNCGVPYYMR